MLLAQPWIKEVDMNPVLAGPEGAIALDARVVLHDATTAGEQAAQAIDSAVSGRICYILGAQ